MVAADRIQSIDAVRGVAVMGILLMNIVAFGLPSAAYIDPTIYGLDGPLDAAAWAINYVVSDGKFRTLFCLLFGASMVLIAERADANADGLSPAATHYRRMIWLLVIGMIHAWLVWFGDILVQYAIAGIIAFFWWRARPRVLWTIVAAMLALQVVGNMVGYAELAPARAAALAPEATADEIAKWDELNADEQPTPEELKAEIDGYRGDFASVFKTRAETTAFFQGVIVPFTMPDTLAIMTLGIIFFRNGFLTSGWTRRRYLQTIAVGYGVGVPVMAFLAHQLIAADFDPATVVLADSIALFVSIAIALAHAAVVVLIVRHGMFSALMSRIEAVGRTALSNYLAMSLIATTIFYGYGLGWFGMFSRAELYGFVGLIWVAMMLWSTPWLASFHYGPAEWLWRSLVQFKWQPIRKP